MWDIENLSSRIIRQPEEFHNGASSIHALLKETGYFDHYHLINEKHIAKELAKRPEYINHWLELSADKRTGSGWYIEQTSNGKFQGGLIPVNDEILPIEYSDPVTACASSIKREIEDIRLN